MQQSRAHFNRSNELCNILSHAHATDKKKTHFICDYAVQREQHANDTVSVVGTAQAALCGAWKNVVTADRAKSASARKVWTRGRKPMQVVVHTNQLRALSGCECERSLSSQLGMHTHTHTPSILYTFMELSIWPRSKTTFHHRYYMCMFSFRCA